MRLLALRSEEVTLEVLPETGGRIHRVEFSFDFEQP